MKKTTLSALFASLLIASVVSLSYAQTSGTDCNQIANEGARSACFAAQGQDDVTPTSATPATGGAQPALGGTPSISGDEVCGSTATTECTPTHFKEISKRLLVILTMLGGAVLVIMICIRLVISWYAYRSGDAGAIKRAGEQAFNAMVGFFIIFAVFGGLYLALLSYFGTQPWATQLFKLFSDAFIPHAYAQTSAPQLLPNALGSNSAYDILLAGINLGMRFFVYPAIIVMWVWSGFQFVYARGNPDGLSKAKSWLFWAVIITVVAIMLQGFLLAFKNTAQKILPATSSTSGSPTPSGQTAQQQQNSQSANGNQNATGDQNEPDDGDDEEDTIDGGDEPDGGSEADLGVEL